jgi:hypothetical protein
MHLVYSVQLGNGEHGTDVRVRNNRLHCQNCYSNDEGVLFLILLFYRFHIMKISSLSNNLFIFPKCVTKEIFLFYFILLFFIIFSLNLPELKAGNVFLHKSAFYEYYDCFVYVEVR